MQGAPGPDFVAYVRQQLWQAQVPAITMPGPGGGAIATLDNGQAIHFPDTAAVGWFLHGYDLGYQTARQDLEQPAPGPSEEG